MQLFNLYDDGSQEIVEAVGMISDNVDFSKWAPHSATGHTPPDSHRGRGRAASYSGALREKGRAGTGGSHTEARGVLRLEHADPNA